MRLFHKNDDNLNQRVKQAMEMLNFENPDETLSLVDGIIADLEKYTPDEIKKRDLVWEAINAYNIKGSILNGKKDLNGAKNCFDIVLNNYDDLDSCANMNNGIISKKRKNYKQAIDYYDKALIKASEEISHVISDAKNEVYSKMSGDSDYLGSISPKAMELIEKGNENCQNQDYWAAFDCYEQAINEDSSCNDMVFGLIEQTKMKFTNIFMIHPIENSDDEKTQLKRTALYYIYDNYLPSMAFSIINKVLDEYDENDLFALNLKGVIYFYMDELEKAVESFNQCLEVDNDYLYASFNKAIVLKRMGKIDDARESFKEIMSMPLKFPNPSEELARLYRLTIVFNSMFYIDLL